MGKRRLALSQGVVGEDLANGSFGLIRGRLVKALASGRLVHGLAADRLVAVPPAG
jgi:hypothetical protein